MTTSQGLDEVSQTSQMLRSNRVMVPALSIVAVTVGAARFRSMIGVRLWLGKSYFTKVRLRFVVKAQVWVSTISNIVM